MVVLLRVKKTSWLIINVFFSVTSFVHSSFNEFETFILILPHIQGVASPAERKRQSLQRERGTLCSLARRRKSTRR